MATYTPNIGLHQWVPEDNFLRSDFNEDFSKIDAAIQKVKTDAASSNTAVQTLAESKCRIVTGTYTGNAYADGAPRDINLGFRPAALLLERYDGARVPTEGGTYAGLALPGYNLYYDGKTSITITSTGFQAARYSNINGVSYRYIAFV